MNSLMDVHIEFSYLNGLQDVSIDDEIKNVRAEGLNLRVNVKEPEAYAAFEWIIPTAFGVYIAKPYFEGFLQEAGKDHYILLKKSLKKLAVNSKNIMMKIFTAGRSVEKANKSYNQSLAYSIVIKTKENRTVKLLFDNDLTKEDWEQAIDLLFDYVIENYEKHPNDRLTQNIKGLNQHPNFYIYALIDKESKDLVFYDDNGLLKLQAKNKKEI